MKTEECRNCGLKMKVDVSPYLFDEKGENTVVASFYGGFCCTSECEKEFDKRMRRSSEKSLYL